MHKQKVTKLGSQNFIFPKVTKLGSIIFHMMNYSGVAVLRLAAHTQQKLTQVHPPPPSPPTETCIS